MPAITMSTRATQTDSLNKAQETQTEYRPRSNGGQQAVDQAGSVVRPAAQPWIADLPEKRGRLLTTSFAAPVAAETPARIQVRSGHVLTTRLVDPAAGKKLVPMLDAETSTSPTTRDAKVQSNTHHDIHNHSFGPGYAVSQVFDNTRRLGENAEKQIELFNQAGVHYTSWAPIPTNMVAHDGGHCCGHTDEPPTIGAETYYMPDTYRFGAKPMSHEAFNEITQKGEQYYDPSVNERVAKAYKELPKELQARIYPAITGLHLGDSNSVHRIMDVMKEYPETFRLIGEITIQKEFVDRQNKSYTPDFSARAPINDILRFAGRAGLPVVLHCDCSEAEHSIKNDVAGDGAYYKGMENLLARHPKTEIVWAHMGGVGKFAPPPEGHAQKLRKMLTNHPNLKLDMSWDVVAENYSPNPGPSYNATPETRAKFDPKSPGYDAAYVAADEAKRAARIKEMAELIRDFPDRFIMGSDALVSRTPESISSTYAIYSNTGRGAGTGQRPGLFDHLPPDVLQRILTGNFESLMQTAEERVGAYERNVLPRDLARLQSSVEGLGRVPNIWPSQSSASTVSNQEPPVSNITIEL